MLKIAYIGQKGILNPLGGGVETHVEELSARMAKKGYEVFLYTRPYYTPKEYQKFEEVNLISLPSLHTKHLDAISHSFLAMLDALRRGVDIIHIHGVGPSLLSFLPRLLSPKTKVIVTAHSEDWEHQKWNFFARFMLQLGARFAALFAHEVLTVSRRFQKYYLANFNRSVTLIPNGVVRRENKNVKEDLIAPYNLKRGQYLLTVSRLIRHKGIHYLIEAFKQAKEKNPAWADFKLVIVGQTFFTDSYFEFLKKLVDGRNDIIFAGAQRGEVLEQLYQNAYLYVSPSESEGLSISCLEAMSYGKAPLVSDISANLDLIKGDTELGSVGFTFANKNITDLAAKLELLWQHPEIVRQVGNKARAYVKIYYNWNDIIDLLNHLYRASVAVKDKLTLWELFLFRRTA